MDWRTDSLEKTLMLGRLKGGGEGDDRGWDGWMASPTQWTWAWASSGRWLRTGKLACCSPWGHKESDCETEQQHAFFSLLDCHMPLCQALPICSGSRRWMDQVMVHHRHLKATGSYYPYNKITPFVCVFLSFHLGTNDIRRKYFPSSHSLISWDLKEGKKNRLVPNKKRSTSRLYIVTLLI